MQPEYGLLEEGGFSAETPFHLSVGQENSNPTIMIHLHESEGARKGWYLGPWNSDVPIPVGYATAGVDEPHVHAQMYEIYLVASGESRAVVAGERVTLAAGDLLVVEPGEVHTFVDSSPDYFHFVVQVPFVKGDTQLVPDEG